MAHYPTIKPIDLIGCLTWLDQAERGGTPDPALLFCGLPHGRIRKAALTKGGDIEVTLYDEREKKNRTPRIFDAPGFCVTRLVLAAKAYIRIGPHSPGLDYVMVFDDIGIFRVIGGARPNEAIRQLKTRDGGHYDVRRSNLGRTAARPDSRTKPAHQGRAVVVTKALEAFDKLPDTHWLRRSLRREHYRALMERSFAILDRLPLGDDLKDAAE